MIMVYYKYELIFSVTVSFLAEYLLVSDYWDTQKKYKLCVSFEQTNILVDKQHVSCFVMVIKIFICTKSHSHFWATKKILVIMQAPNSTNETTSRKVQMKTT